MNMEFHCHRIAEGKASGRALISKDDICFYLVEPETGVVIEKGHDLEGRSVAGKVLVFPSGKGSSVVQADGLYQMAMRGTAPKAMIIQHPEPVLVASAIIMGVPLVDRAEDLFYKTISDDVIIEVDADNSKLIISR
jgi:predicted aconitase with swiveling domain